MIGADEGSTLSVGASSAVRLPLGAQLQFVEHTGAAIGAGETSLFSLEHQMVQTGAELLLLKPGARTATEANNDAEGNKSDLQRLVETFEDSLDKCLKFMAQWRKIDMGEGRANLFKDFGAATLSDATAQLVVTMQQTGLLTKATALREQQRRGVLAPDLDVTAEIDAAKAEGPPLGTMTTPPANANGQ